ncbi:hypothetical protein PGQ11_012656 [Apiospora arundinis]|uniref:2EXR domain-containing protein n=1 Tax=Apiospora arundinis TaxID=335852 RepID=A0ABR2I2X6_9PEZI
MEKANTQKAPLRKRKTPTRVSARRSRPLTHFHLFPNLPAELQLMIWSFWRADQPALRHYMGLTNNARYYAALNPTTREFIKTTARSTESDKDDPVDPMEYQIRFTNSIMTTQGKYQDPLDVVHLIDGSRLDRSKERYARLAPAFAWVNFEKDAFCIENLGHRYETRFRFLLHNIGAKVPKPLAADHWASRIQTLTLHTTCEPKSAPLYLPWPTWWSFRVHGIPSDMVCTYFNPVPLSDIDDQVLGIMSSLKRVLLVMKSYRLCPLLYRNILHDRIGSNGYVEYSVIQAIHTPGHALYLDGEGKCDGGCHLTEITEPEVITDMRQKLDGMGKQRVEVKLVADIVKARIHNDY